MTVIRPNSVSGITSITAQANEINFFRSNGTLAGLQLNGVNFNTTTGVSTFNNLDVGGVLTYQDVTNVDSVGIITARSTIDAQGDVSIADKIIHTGDTNTAIRFPTADTISFETAGNERLRITSGGLMGLATNSPTGTLSIASGTFQTTTPHYTGDDIVISGSNSLGISFLTLASGTSNNNIYFGDTDDTDVGMIRYAHADNSMQFRTNATERLRIDSSGRVLIGHSSNFSGYALQVSGGDEENSSLSLSRFKANASSSVLEFNKSRNNGIGNNTVVQNNDTIGVIRFKAADGTDYSQVADIQATIDGTPSNNDTPGRLIFSTTASGAQYTTERLRIGSSGQIGLGGANYGSSGQVLTSQGSGSAPQWATPSSDLVNDTSPQLGGNLDSNGNNIKLGDSSSSNDDRLQIGAATFGDLELYHDGTNSYIDNATNDLFIRNTGDDIIIQAADNITLAVQGGENGIAIAGNGGVQIYHDNSLKFETYSDGVITNGHILPYPTNTYDLGATSYRWRNIYTNDLNLSNKGSTNSVDGTWGDYTIQEGESDLFLINNRNGKKYKFNLTEVS